MDAILRLHILPAIGYMKIDGVKSYHLQRFPNMQASKSNSQLQKIRGVINQIFQRTELDYIINHSPARKLFLLKDTERPRRSLTEVERLALYKATEYDGTFLRLNQQKPRVVLGMYHPARFFAAIERALAASL